MRGKRRGEGSSHVWKVRGQFEARCGSGRPPSRALALCAQVNRGLPISLYRVPGEGRRNIWHRAVI